MTSRPDPAQMADGPAGPSAPAGRRLRYAARAALDGWRHALGGRCAVCRGWCGDGLCACCAARFAFARPRCPGCALPVLPRADGPDPDDAPCLRCRLAPPPWSRAVTGLDYGYPWDRLLAGLKFHQRLDTIDVLLRPLLAALRGGVGPDVRLVAVPLARERLRERGYNQSWELARRLARDLGLESRPDALFRVRDTAHQLSLHRDQRVANLRGAFVVTPRHAAWVRGASVALVDDVLTTGATAQSAARTLLAAGAREVQVWTVARTP